MRGGAIRCGIMATRLNVAKRLKLPTHWRGVNGLAEANQWARLGADRCTRINSPWSRRGTNCIAVNAGSMVRINDGREASCRSAHLPRKTLLISRSAIETGRWLGMGCQAMSRICEAAWQALGERVFTGRAGARCGTPIHNFSAAVFPALQVGASAQDAKRPVTSPSWHMDCLPSAGASGLQQGRSQASASPFLVPFKFIPVRPGCRKLRFGDTEVGEDSGVSIICYSKGENERERTPTDTRYTIFLGVSACLSPQRSEILGQGSRGTKHDPRLPFACMSPARHCNWRNRPFRQCWDCKKRVVGGSRYRRFEVCIALLLWKPPTRSAWKFAGTLTLLCLRSVYVLSVGPSNRRAWQSSS